MNEGGNLVRPMTPPQMKKPKKQMGIAWRAVNPIPITVEIVDQRGGASMSLHPVKELETIVQRKRTVVEVVPYSPGTILDRNRIKILITPTWIDSISSSRWSEFQVKRLELREPEPRTILQFLAKSHLEQNIVDTIVSRKVRRSRALVGWILN